MAVVIDFSGYYYQNQFIIKEFCKCYISECHMQLYKTIITDSPSHFKRLFSNHNYSNYYKVCGINQEIGNQKIYTLRNNINNTLKIYKTVYLKNLEQYKLLMKFVRNTYTNVKLLDKLGFDERREAKNLACEYHNDKVNNYCARATVIAEAKWLMNLPSITMKLNKPKIIRKQSKFLYNKLQKTETIDNRTLQLVVNLNGYYNLINEFLIKELSIYIVNAEGVIVDDQFLVSQPNDSLKNSPTMFNKYNNEYFCRYGIVWSAGNCTLKEIKTKINAFLDRYRIQYIFVENFDMKQKIVKLIEDNNDYDIICLSNYGYNYENEQKVSLAKKCMYHTHPNPEKNVCAKSRNIVMLEWILKMQLYKQEIVESVKNFTILSQIERNSNNFGNSTAVNSNVQLRSINTNSNDDLSGYVDINIDEILDRPSSSGRLDTSMSFNDDELLLGGNLAHSSATNQQFRDSDLKVDDQVLDQLDIRNFYSSWLENIPEPIDVGAILGDDRSNVQINDNDLRSQPSDNDTDNDSFEKLLQFGGNDQSVDSMLDLNYEELDQFLL